MPGSFFTRQFTAQIFCPDTLFIVWHFYPLVPDWGMHPNRGTVPPLRYHFSSVYLDLGTEYPHLGTVCLKFLSLILCMSCDFSADMHLGILEKICC